MEPFLDDSAAFPMCAKPKRSKVRRKDRKDLAHLERELRLNEERWRAVMNNPFMGISVLDKDQYFIMTNSTYQVMVGYTDEELKKLTPLDITPVDDREVNRVLFQELQQGKRDHYELVKRLQRKDGKVIWIQLYVFGIPDAESIGQRTFGMIFDITEKMQTQNALQTVQAELARSTQASRMGAMAASIAHEINQPLSAMIGSAQAGLRWIGQSPPKLDEAAESFKQIRHDGRRAADVVEGIRAMFKSGETSRSLLDLNQLIGEVLRLTDSQLQRRAVVVHTELDAELAPVMASRTQLQQVLVNLVTNAIEAMEPVIDRRRVMKIKSERAGTEEVRVTVEDSGKGIDPQNLDQIFSSFFTTKTEGMGMGLSICRSIIESHGGRLLAAQGRPYGAVFQFTLPAKRR
jgi:PAS domain S-box-containing protein